MFLKFTLPNASKALIVAATSLLLSFQVFSQIDNVTDVDSGTKIAFHVPKSLPIKFSGGGLIRTIEGAQVLRFETESMTADSVKAVQFLAIVVDEKGRVKSGQSWRTDKVLDPLTPLRVDAPFNHDVKNGDKVLVAAYSGIGSSKPLASVAPAEIFKAWSDQGQIQGNAQHKKLAESLMDDNVCASAQSAAAAACRCGIKAFSCNPQTGAYSFSCFSPQENPLECRPEN